MEAEPEAELIARTLAMMCSGPRQKDSLNVQKKKQRSTPLSVTPSSLQKEVSDKPTRPIKWLSAH